MILAVADTHAVIWYLANDSRLGTNAKAMFTEVARKGDEIAISAITLVEIVYLVERNRISAGYFSQLMTDLDSNDSVLVEVALSPAIVRTLTKNDWSQVPAISGASLRAKTVAGVIHRSPHLFTGTKTPNRLQTKQRSSYSTATSYQSRERTSPTR